MSSFRSGRAFHVAAELSGGPGPDADVPRADRAGFAFAAFDDSPAGGFALDATVRAGYWATRTSRLGLAPTSHVLTAEPFHLAAQLASLDHATHGRAAWIVGTASTPEALATVGRSEADHLRQEVADVVEAVRLLWDSWEDDAVVKDLATGRYLDPDKVHHVDFAGETFSVKGPLITPRPPQGQPVVLAATEFADVVRPDIVLVRGDFREEAWHAREIGTPLVFGELGFDGGSGAGFAARLAGLATDLDGVLLHVADPADLPVLAEQVLPELRQLGLHTPPEPGATLRATLGLPRPANRFASLSKGIA